MEDESHSAEVTSKMPRIVITFCTQCKWMLRAAWLQQELLSTFGTSIGEIALVPSTGGVFTIQILHKTETTQDKINTAMIWDRKVDGGKKMSAGIMTETRTDSSTHHCRLS
jgi:selT/selW/selH-like putative selenoprotein